MQIDIFQIGVTDVLNFAIFSKEIDVTLLDSELLKEIFTTKKEALKALHTAKGYNFSIYLFFETSNEFCDLMQIVSFLNDYAKGVILEVILNNEYVIKEE